MNLNTENAQDFAVIQFMIRTGQLTMVLASSAQVSNERLYEKIKNQQNMDVMHVFSAAGKMDIRYPPGISVHICDMYDTRAEKIKALRRFWNACLETANAGQAVVIHSKTGYYRAPLAVAAIMVMAGHPIHRALMEMREKTYIYDGLLVCWQWWPESHQKHVLTKPLWDCYDFIRLELVEIMKFDTTDVASQCGNISAVGEKRARSKSPLKQVPNTNDDVAHTTFQTVSAQCDEKDVTAANANVDSKDKRPRKHWVCAQCQVTSTNLRKCWECDRWECRKCSFWCTFCPAEWQRKYTICSHCYEEGSLLVRYENKWCCTRCGAARYYEWCQYG